MFLGPAAYQVPLGSLGLDDTLLAWTGLTLEDVDVSPDILNFLLEALGLNECRKFVWNRDAVLQLEQSQQLLIEILLDHTVREVKESDLVLVASLLEVEVAI